MIGWILAISCIFGTILNCKKTLWMLEKPIKVVLTETDNETTKRRFKIKDNNETKDFIQWMNTNTKAQFFIKYIRTTLPSRYMYNRLWEIYNERDNK